MNELPHECSLLQPMRMAVLEGLKILHEFISTRHYIPRYYQFPTISWFESGMPSFGTCLDNAPLNYVELFGDSETAKIRANEIPSWIAFRRAAEADPAYNLYFGLGENGPDFGMPKGHALAEDFIRYYSFSNTCGIIAEMVNRIIHITNKIEFDENCFMEIYIAWKNCWSSKCLPFQVWIPILGVPFEFDSFPLSEGAMIEKMPVDFQLARNVQVDFTTTAHKAMVGAATHALVLSGWSVENESKYIRQRLLGQVANYSKILKIVNQFFGVFRTITGIDSGYCQLIARPVLWMCSTKANLPEVYVVTQRGYPEHLDNFGWLRKIDPVNTATASRIADLYQRVLLSNANNLSVAIKRLNMAMLRREEIDSIIDISIGFESLLGDNEKNEITHKLALRTAALCKTKKFENHTPSEVFKMVKDMYKYRSAIVHGSHKLEKSRSFKLTETKSIPIVELGLRLLRHIIEIMIIKPEFTANFIDEQLLLNYQD